MACIQFKETILYGMNHEKHKLKAWLCMGKYWPCKRLY